MRIANVCRQTRDREREREMATELDEAKSTFDIVGREGITGGRKGRRRRTFSNKWDQ